MTNAPTAIAALDMVSSPASTFYTIYFTK